MPESHLPAVAFCLLVSCTSPGPRPQDEAARMNGTNADAAPDHLARGQRLLETARQQVPMQLRSLQQAETELLIAKKLDPQAADARLALAALYEAEGHLSRACAELDELLVRSPQHVGALKQASRLRFELGEERLAMALCDRLLAMQPDDADVRYRLAYCQSVTAESLLGGLPTLDRDDRRRRSAKLQLESARNFATYRRGRPADVEGCLGEARARFRATQLDDAGQDQAVLTAVIKIYEDAAGRWPKNAAIWHGAAIVREAMGDRDRARRDHQAVLERDPRHVPSTLALIAILDAAGDLPAAKAMAKRALQLDLSSQERRALSRYLGANPNTEGSAVGARAGSTANGDQQARPGDREDRAVRHP